jgi:hypothetical protein
MRCYRKHELTAMSWRKILEQKIVSESPMLKDDFGV